MAKDSAPAPLEQWTLIRGARQLLTLRGPSGPRRGAAMNQLNIISDGALLIRNGIIEESGPARRVENLARSRQAREIDASGSIIMPAFVDPDAVLVAPSLPARTDLRVMSRRILEVAALALAREWTRLGLLTIGAHTRYASTLRDTVKILRIHRSLQRKPLRIRSILAPGIPLPDDLQKKWLPLIRRRNLAAIIEFSAPVAECAWSVEDLRDAAISAADHGLSVRIRSSGIALEAMYALAREAGALAWIGFPPADRALFRDFGGILILPASDVLASGRSHVPEIRHAVDDGIPLALASGYGIDGPASANPQFLLWLGASRLGLTAEEAIVAATYNAACALRMSHVTGSLEPGKAANLIVMDVPDYRELSRRVGHSDVLEVLSDGESVYRRGVVGKLAPEKPDPRL